MNFSLPNNKNKHSEELESYSKYAQMSSDELLGEFKTNLKGLSEKEVEERVKIYGYNQTERGKKVSLARLILSKFFDPLVAMLAVIAIISLFFDNAVSALIVGIMIVISVIIDVVQEYSSNKSVEELNALVKTKIQVMRGGKEVELDIYEVVPGDIIILNAGDMIAADIRIIECKDLFINQSSLTGESFPVEKSNIHHGENVGITEFKNIAFMGSSVVSGTATAIAIKTGKYTQFGQISKSLGEKKLKTSFERGIEDFTYLMLKSVIFLSIGIFAIILFIKHGTFNEALLFSLAVAIGLTPEMLPMIVTINLSKGAKVMAEKKVIVRKLESIQNFGAMDILCTDKTGTLTMDSIVLEHHCTIDGIESEEVLKYAYINSFNQTGLKNILDNAILKYETISMQDYQKIDEIPFDFSRKIMSVAVKNNDKNILVTKGAPEEIFLRCKYFKDNNTTSELNEEAQTAAKKEYEKLSSKGFRVLGISYRNFDISKTKFGYEDEHEMTFIGFAAFLDPPKPSAKTTISTLNEKGIEVKILTGDNEFITQKICKDVNIQIKDIITGPHLETKTDEELRTLVEKYTIFARLSPLQKERIIKALQQNGHVVGYMGDGINDAPSLKAADIGISVNNAVDVAKESADIILLEKDLTVIEEGVIEGRRTFGNIVKYIKMGSSSNFGNMLSMAGATVFLPFLPMLPVQILFNNFLYDMSNLTVTTDKVDDEYIAKPRPWNVDFIRKFMLFIGPLSSIFDFLTFAVMWFVFLGFTQTPFAQATFHTGWFIESLCTQTLIIFVIRTDKIPFVESKPSKYMIWSAVGVIAFGIFITFSKLGEHFGFVALPLKYFVILIGLILAYLTLVFFVKRWLVKKYNLVD